MSTHRYRIATVAIDKKCVPPGKSVVWAKDKTPATFNGLKLMAEVSEPLSVGMVRILQKRDDGTDPSECFVAENREPVMCDFYRGVCIGNGVSLQVLGDTIFGMEVINNRDHDVEVAFVIIGEHGSSS